MDVTKEQIEQLKNNEKPFGLMSKELQSAMAELDGAEAMFGRFKSDKEWIPCGSVKGFHNDATYRLRPDYQPEPSIVECEIVDVDGLLMFNVNENLRDHLNLVVNRKDFIGFKFEDGKVLVSPIKFKSKTNSMPYHPLPFEWFSAGSVEVLHATHVLFRASK